MPNHLYKPSSALLNLSQHDAWTLDDAYMGTFICGGTGSGKSSGSGRTIAHAFLRAGFGGLVLCAKPEEAKVWQRYCKATGRGNSLIILGGDSPHRFNFLEYELARLDGGMNKTPFALEALLKIYEAMQTYDGVKGDESFWRNSVRLILSHSIDSLYAAYGRLRFTELMDFINSTANSREEFNNEEWRAESFHYLTLQKAGKDAVKPINFRDYTAVISYFRSFAELDKKTKSNIIATLQAMVMDFQKGDLAQIFCTDTTIVPELSHYGAIIVLDFPLKIWQRGGVLAQQLFKFAWMRAIERRRVQNTTRPCFLWADEYQFFISSYDAEFQSTARSSRACTVYMTQSVPALRDSVKSTIPKENVDALLNNFQTTIIHTIKDPTTQEWAAQMIGKGIQWRYTENQSQAQGESWGKSKGKNWGWNWGRASSLSEGSSSQGGSGYSSTEGGMNSSTSSSWNFGWGRNSQTGREVELALPASVSAKERENITRKIAVYLTERYGVAVAVALHEPSKHGDGRNYHAHMLMTTRRMGENGLTEKTRELDDRKTGGKEITHIRYFAAAAINESLAGSGSNERVDPRSNKERGIEQLPTKHLGVEASAMERKKKRSRLGDINRDIEGSNQRITALQKECATLDREISKEQKPKTTREQHYNRVREQLAVIKQPKIAKATYGICESVGYENLRKRLIKPPTIEPPINPLDPTPTGSYRANLQRERETQGSDISR